MKLGANSNIPIRWAEALYLPYACTHAKAKLFHADIDNQSKSSQILSKDIPDGHRRFYPDFSVGRKSTQITMYFKNSSACSNAWLHYLQNEYENLHKTPLQQRNNHKK